MNPTQRLKNPTPAQYYTTLDVTGVSASDMRGKATVAVYHMPCECGCGKVVEDGMIEFAHPEDYQYSER